MVQRKRVGDKLGLSFNRLTVVAYHGKGKFDKHYWRCLCECGEVVVLPAAAVGTKYSPISCGCYRKEILLLNRCDTTRHGLTKTQPQLYAIFHSMHQRCKNKKSQRWKYYGAAGIKVSDEWSEVQEFCNWALSNGYEPGLSIDRIDSTKGYHPSNCEWVTRAENSRRMNVTKRAKELA